MCLSTLMSSSDISEPGRVLHNCVSPSSSPVLVLANLSLAKVSKFMVSGLPGGTSLKVLSTLESSLCPLFMVFVQELGQRGLSS